MKFMIFVSMALLVGSCASGPDREPESIPVESADNGETYSKILTDGSRLTVICRKYPIHGLDGRLVKYQEICR